MDWQDYERQKDEILRDGLDVPAFLRHPENGFRLNHIRKSDAEREDAALIQRIAGPLPELPDYSDFPFKQVPAGTRFGNSYCTHCKTIIEFVALEAPEDYYGCWECPFCLAGHRTKGWSVVFVTRAIPRNQ